MAPAVDAPETKVFRNISPGGSIRGENLTIGYTAEQVGQLLEAAASRYSVPPVILESIQRLGAANPENVQQIAASQLELLTAYHQVALKQSDRSFFWALIGSGFGLLLFAVAVVFSLVNGLSLTSIVPLIAGAVVDVVSGIVFVLYGKTSTQLSAFHSRLEVLQRYLLANSISESLSTAAERDKARAALIGEISRAPRTDNPSPSVTTNRRATAIARKATRPQAATDG